MEGMDAMRDKRFEERDRRRRNTARDAQPAGHDQNLPDLQERTANLAPDNLSDLRDTLVKEKAARDARIQRILNEPVRPLTGAAPQVTPVEFED
jgi:hypothetical protein